MRNDLNTNQKQIDKSVKCFRRCKQLMMIMCGLWIVMFTMEMQVVTLHLTTLTISQPKGERRICLTKESDIQQKLWIVFDCGASVQGTSLNWQLLPDQSQWWRHWSPKVCMVADRKKWHFFRNNRKLLSSIHEETRAQRFQGLDKQLAYFVARVVLPAKRIQQDLCE